MKGRTGLQIRCSGWCGDAWLISKYEWLYSWRVALLCRSNLWLNHMALSACVVIDAFAYLAWWRCEVGIQNPKQGRRGGWKIRSSPIRNAASSVSMLFSCCTGWKEKFVRDYHRFDGNTCKELVAKLTLTLNFKVKHFFCIVFYSSRREDFSKEPNSSLEKSFWII